MIRGYFGLPGSGKTYQMTRDIQNEGRGKTVYTNYHVQIPSAKEVIYISRPEEMINARDGIMLIDEAGLWLPSFIWKRIPEKLIWKLAQVRKSGLDLWYSAQEPARVVKVLREITFESVHTEKFFRFFLCRIHAGATKKDDLISWRIVYLNPRIANLYDTMEEVEVIGRS